MLNIESYESFPPFRKAEEMPVPDWRMIGMTITNGKLIGNGITAES